MRLQRMKISMNKLTWTRMNTEALISLPHNIFILPLVFFLPSFVFYSLCTRSINTLSLLSVRLFLSFSYEYLFVTSPPSTLWPSTYYTQLLCIIICCSSLPPLYTVTITVMYNISQLFQHEKHRKSSQAWHGGCYGKQ